MLKLAEREIFMRKTILIILAAILIFIAGCNVGKANTIKSAYVLEHSNHHVAIGYGDVDVYYTLD